MRISDWSSDVCSSDLFFKQGFVKALNAVTSPIVNTMKDRFGTSGFKGLPTNAVIGVVNKIKSFLGPKRSEEHTSELQSLMRISYAVFCLKKKKNTKHTTHNKINTKKHKQHKSNTRTAKYNTLTLSHI